MRQRRNWLTSTALIGLCMLPATARAQQVDEKAPQATAEAAPPPEGMNDIVVTAQRRAQRLQDVPISVSVTTGAALDSAGVRTLEDLTSRLPNVRIAQVPGSDLLNIRGVGSGINLGFEQAVATFVDGVYRGRARASRLAFFDVDRIEVLRGPQTTFFGNNAIAGALNITTRKPGSSFDYNASALYAPTDGEYSFDAGISAPLTDRLSVRVAGRVSGMDGYIKNARLHNDGPSLDGKIGRVAIHWQPVDIVTVDSRVDVGGLRDKDIFDIELTNCPPDPKITAPRGACARDLAASGGHVDDQLDHHANVGPSYFNFNYVEAMTNVAVEWEGVRLTSITSYYNHDYDYYADVIPTGPTASLVGTTSGLPTRSTEHFHQISQELRFESTGQRFIDYMIGSYLSASKLDAPTASGYFFAPFGAFAPAFFKATDPIEVRYHNREREKVMSVFGSATVHVTRQLRLNLGMRYSIVDKRASRTAQIGVGENSLDPNLFVPGPAAGQAILLPITGGTPGQFAKTHRTDDKFMPSVNVEYNVTPDIMTYASYTKGFKAGGFAIGGTANIFAPETVDAYEVGIKSTLFDRRLTLNLDAFWSDYKNLQESTFVISPTGVPIPSIGNAAASRAKGVEAGGAFRVARGLQLTFDLAYLSSIYRSYYPAPCTSTGAIDGNPATCPGGIANLAGHRRAYAPKWSGNVGASYATALTDKLQMRLDTSLFFTSRYYGDVSGDPLLTQKSYVNWDARIGVGPSDHRWEIAVIGKNLNDATTAQVRRPLPSAAGSAEALADRPRSVAIQLSLRR